MKLRNVSRVAQMDLFDSMKQMRKKMKLQVHLEDYAVFLKRKYKQLEHAPMQLLTWALWEFGKHDVKQAVLNCRGNTSLRELLQKLRNEKYGSSDIPTESDPTQEIAVPA